MASKKGSEVGSKRPSVFSKQSQLQRRHEHEQALLGKQKQIEDENIVVIDPETQQILEEEADNVEELDQEDKMTSVS